MMCGQVPNWLDIHMIISLTKIFIVIFVVTVSIVTNYLFFKYTFAYLSILHSKIIGKTTNKYHKSIVLKFLLVCGTTLPHPKRDLCMLFSGPLLFLQCYFYSIIRSFKENGLNIWNKRFLVVGNQNIN